MRVRLAVLALSGLFLLVSVPAPASARTGKPAVSTDSSAMALAGVYSSNGAPAYQVVIKPLGYSLLVVGSDSLFYCAGFWDGNVFVGIVAQPDGSVRRVATGGYEWLSLRPLGGGRVQVMRSATSKKGKDHEEVWTRVGALGGGPPSSDKAVRVAPSDSSGGLPRFGEYVYIDSLPEAIEKVAPDYPEWARRKGIEGTVMLQALVGRDGLVKDVRVVRSIPELDDYAIAAAKQWRFVPAKAQGQPVAVWVAIPVKFTLH